MEHHCIVEDEVSNNETKEIYSSTTGLSPLAESLFLSPPSSNSENKFRIGCKLVRCTSTPSYSSLFRSIEAKDPLFTADIQLDKVEEVIRKKTHVKDSNPNQDSALESSNVSCNDSDASSFFSREGGKRALDGLDPDCLVSLAKRKEDFYAKIETNTLHHKGSSKNTSNQALGESISISEPDSGFETMCSSTCAESIGINDSDRKICTTTGTKISLRRSPRNASLDCTNNTNSSPHLYQNLSSSPGAIPKSTNQVLTRSKSLRLSGDSYFDESPSPPKGKKAGRYIPAEHDLAKASTSLISKFDISLIEDRGKLNINLQDNGECTKFSSFPFLPTESEETQKPPEGVLKGRLSKSSHNTIGENKSKERIPALVEYHTIHRDIPFGCGFGKRSRQNLGNKVNKEKRGNFGRIVYSPGVFHGRERLDIVRRLNDMSANHILDKIWCSLSAGDLGRGLQVSKTWNQSIIENKDAILRLKEAKHRLLENPPPTKSGVLRRLSQLSGGNLPITTRSSQRLLLLKESPRKALSSVSNILLDPDSHQAQQVVRRNKNSVIRNLRSSSDSVLQRQTSSEQNNAFVERKQQTSKAGICKRGSANQLSMASNFSPSKLRHRLFTEEASRLAPGEQLKSCPRCTSPSRVKPIESWAECSRISCQFSFCIRCLCVRHAQGLKCKSTTKLSTSSKKPSNTKLIFPEIAEEQSELLIKRENSSSSSAGSYTTSESTYRATSLGNEKKVLNSKSSNIKTRAPKATVDSKKSRSRLKRL